MNDEIPQFGNSAPGATQAPVPPPPLPPCAAPPPPPPRRRGFFVRLWHGCLVASFAIVLLSVLSTVAAVWCAAKIAGKFDEGLLAATGAESEVAEDAELEPVTELNLARAGDAPADDAPLVLFVPVVGEITSGAPERRFWETDAGTAGAALRAIRRATLDPRIEGVFLRIDSPGGEVSASDETWNALKAFRAAPGESGSPRFVVALMGGMAASGAYYICAAADFIVAHPTTITGSIGVKMSSVNVRGLADKLGVKEVAIVSGENKNVLSPFEDLSPEQREMLQRQVDAMHERFVALVAEGRGLAAADVRRVADGRILLADEAKAAGLVDAIGYLDDAKAEIARRLGGETPRYVVYSEGGSFLQSFLSPEFFGAALRSAVVPNAAAAGASSGLKGKGL